MRAGDAILDVAIAILQLERAGPKSMSPDTSTAPCSTVQYLEPLCSESHTLSLLPGVALSMP